MQSLKYLSGIVFSEANQLIIFIMAHNNNRYAVITGATSGIGYEFAKLFASDGYNLVIVSRTKEDLNKVASELAQQHGVDVIPLAKDLFEHQAPFEIYDEIKSKGITVDVLVNDAGQGEWGFFSETDIEREVKIIHLNIISLVVLTKLFLKDMLARNEGKILQVSSIVGQLPAPLMAVYGGTKAFVLKFSEALINELKDSAVTLTVLQPGATETDFFHKAGAEETYEWQESKLSNPADVAKDGYEALMSGESRIVSGAKNKMMTTMSNVMPEQALAANMRKHMSESDERNRPIKGGGDTHDEA